MHEKLSNIFLPEKAFFTSSVFPTRLRPYTTPIVGSFLLKTKQWFGGKSTVTRSFQLQIVYHLNV
jgi:hypothetical protein